MEKTINFNNVSLYTQSFGESKNPAILLVMGAMSSLVWWDEKFCNILAEKGYFVIRYDNRDTGKSTCYPAGSPEYSIDDLADDAIKVLDEYQIDKAIVMGMSMGGFIAQILGVKYPERIQGLILFCTMYFAEGADKLKDSSDSFKNFFSNMDLSSLDSLEKLVDFSMKQWEVTSNSRKKKDIDYHRLMTRLDIQRANSYSSRINHALLTIKGDELTRINEIKVPTLVMHGTDDEVIDYSHALMLDKTIPNSKLVTLEGSGHEINPLDYEVIIKEIVDFFKC